jgi:hypothetical protein
MNHPSTLAGVIARGLEQIDGRGLEGAVAMGGAISGLLARQTDAGVRAWTLEQAAAHLGGMDVLDAQALYALHQGALIAWSILETDQRLAELTASQLELEVAGT